MLLQHINKHFDLAADKRKDAQEEQIRQAEVKILLRRSWDI